MHEIVTLQFGQQSNYVGTHFWNAQESYFTYGQDEESPVDHDIHFRPGVGVDGTDTYTPRTLIYDLKGAFGTLRRENALYGLQEGSVPEQGPWSGPTNVIRHEAIPPSPYQQALDQGIQPLELSTASVRFWSDYNRVFYHPRSIVQLHEYELNSSLMPFERWTTGEELFSNLDKEHDLLDRDLRPFLEECDQLQGLQMLTSTDDAWGGFAARYLDRIRDELGKTSAWVWGLEEGSRMSRTQQMLHTANVAQSVYQISSQASMYIPLTSSPSSLPGYISGFDPSSRWHTSAMQAIALETLTLPSRLRPTQSARATLDTLEATLDNGGKRRMASLDFGAEDPAVLDGSLNGHGGKDSRMNGHADEHMEDEESHATQVDIDMMPSVPNFDGVREQHSKNSVFGQIQSLRGKWKSTIEIEEVNMAARDRFVTGPRITSHQSPLLYPSLDSFPGIFDFASRPRTLAVQASLSTSSSVARNVRSIERGARNMVGIDEREALCDGLVSICEEYEDGWDSGSDEDDDG